MNPSSDFWTAQSTTRACKERKNDTLNIEELNWTSELIPVEADNPTQSIYFENISMIKFGPQNGLDKFILPEVAHRAEFDPILVELSQRGRQDSKAEITKEKNKAATLVENEPKQVYKKVQREKVKTEHMEEKSDNRSMLSIRELTCNTPRSISPTSKESQIAQVSNEREGESIKPPCTGHLFKNKEVPATSRDNRSGSRQDHKKVELNIGKPDKATINFFMETKRKKVEDKTQQEVNPEINHDVKQAKRVCGNPKGVFDVPKELIPPSEQNRVQEVISSLENGSSNLKKQTTKNANKLLLAAEPPNLLSRREGELARMNSDAGSRNLSKDKPIDSKQYIIHPVSPKDSRLNSKRPHSGLTPRNIAKQIVAQSIELKPSKEKSLSSAQKQESTKVLLSNLMKSNIMTTDVAILQTELRQKDELICELKLQLSRKNTLIEVVLFHKVLEYLHQVARQRSSRS